MTPADIDSAAERAHTEAIRDHAARLIDGSEAYPFDRDDYCAVIELCDDHDAALDRLEAVEAERDRLARILAVERGDESAAPKGWTMTRPGRWSHPYTDDAHACVYLLDAGPNQWGWYVSAPDASRNHSASAPTALEAMEAADAARGGDDG